jgi:putative hydrolase
VKLKLRLGQKTVKYAIIATEFVKESIMKIEVDTHTHTLASGHAYSTISQMIDSASKRGLKMLAITEHGPAMPGSCHEYYFANGRVLPRDYDGITLLFGVELNILDKTGRVDLYPRLISEMDIVIASLHMQLFEDEGTKDNYTKAYVSAMRNPDIHIIGHPDDSRCLPDYETIVKVAKETNTLLEVNNSSLEPTSFRVGARENVVTMLELCKKYKTKVTTGSDAHVDALVGGFDRVKEIFEYCNFPEELVVTTDVNKISSYLNI